MSLTFIQMSGVPGSGKTTLARALAPVIDAVIIDHDITKSAMLDWDIPVEMAGRASYGVLDALARDLLAQGRSVIFDSPCFYDDLLERGISMARTFDAEYRYIECFVTDIDTLDHRFQSRNPMRSQRRGIAIPPVDVGDTDSRSRETVHTDLIENMKRPESGYLELDTTRPLEECLVDALTYIRAGELQ